MLGRELLNMAWPTYTRNTYIYLLQYIVHPLSSHVTQFKQNPKRPDVQKENGKGDDEKLFGIFTASTLFSCSSSSLVRPPSSGTFLKFWKTFIVKCGKGLVHFKPRLDREVEEEELYLIEKKKVEEEELYLIEKNTCGAATSSGSCLENQPTTPPT